MTRTGWIAVAIVVVLAGAGGWFLRGQTPDDATPAMPDATSEVAYYTCPMHPSVKASEPGSCPICGMDLTPVPKAGGTAAAGGDTHADHAEGGTMEVAYYTCPMHPSVKASEPGSCPICGMDLTPVPKAQPGGAGAMDTNMPGFITLTSFQQQLIGVKTEPVMVRPTSTEVRTVARVTYDETQWPDVNLKVSGWLRDLYVDHVGKPVQKGERLFTLYSPELVSSQEEYLLAYRGMHQLSGAEGGKAQEEALAWNRRLLASGRERLLLWDLTESQIRELEQTGKRQTAVTVYAPASGIVTDRMAVSGMFVKPGMQLYRIARLDTVWIKADVYEHELPFVHRGQEATVTLSYLPDRTFSGTVDYVYPYLDPKSRTATLRIKVANPDLSLLPDMYADVILHGTPDRQLMVPESAVLFSGRRRIVFISLGEGRFRPQEVQLGQRYTTGYEVLSGVREGDRVVTSANFLLDSESKLKNVMADMGGGAHQH